MEKKNKSVRSKHSLPTDPEKGWRGSEAGYRAIVETSLDGIYQVDTSGKFTFINESFASTFGYKREELLGEQFSSLLSAETLPRVVEMVEEVLRGKNVREEVPIQHKDGHEAPVSFSATPLRANGKIVGLTGILRDITERKRAEEALRKSIQLLNDTGEMAKVGGWELDLATKEVFLTEEVARIHGVSTRYKVSLEEGINFYAPESIPVLEEALKKTSETGEPYDLELLFIPSGSKDNIWVRCIGRAIYSCGKIVKLAGTFQNIDKYKRAREALKVSEEKWRSLTENSPDYIMLLDLDATILFINRTVPDLTKDEVIGTSNFKYVPPEFHRTMADCFKRVVKSGNSDMYATAYHTKGGETRYAEVRIGPVFKDGQVVGFISSSTDITERKQAQEALQKSEERYRTLYESSRDGIVAVDLNGYITECNQAYADMLGYSREELKEIRFIDLTPSKWHAINEAYVRQVMMNGHASELEKEYIRKDGTILPVSLYTWRKDDDAGNPVALWSVVRDITERKKAEKTLRRSEEHLQALVENSHEAIVVLKGDGTISYGTPSIERMLGYTSEDLLGTQGFGFADPHDMPKVMESFEHLMKNPSSIVHIELRIQHKDGSWRIVEAVARNLLENKAVGGIVINWRDITERKKAEEELRRLSDAVKMSTDSIVVTDMRGNILDGNEASVRMYGADNRADLIGMKAFDIIVPEDREKAYEKMKAVMEKGYVSGLEYHVLSRDGRKILVEASAAIMRGSKGEPIGFVGVSRDITERKRAEEELGEYRRHLEELVEERTTNLKDANERLQREIAERQQAEDALRASEERFRNIVESIPIPVVIGRMSDGVILYGNRQFVLTAGLSLEELTGRRIWDFYNSPPERKDVLNHLLREARITEREFRGKRADGTAFWAIASVRPLKFEGDEAILTAFHDITARKKAEEELESLYQRERDLRRQLEEEMKKRVEFTRTLAHELKTPLTPVVLSSQELVAMLKEETSLRLAKIIERGSSNLSSRIDELLDLAKGEKGMLKLKREYIDVVKLLDDVVEEMVAVSGNRGQKLTWEPHTALPKVWADIVRVRQIVMNLLNNAFKFTPRQGQITVRAKREEHNLVIEVSDNGPGIKKQDQERLFNPYDRVEDDRERLSGLGLGLALCKTFVELHGGQIWLKSAPGKGSTFSFSLPLGAPE